jgi:hypothetical protein
MSASSGLSPKILLGQIAVSLQVMAGRQPLVGSFGVDASALWQAIGASMVFTLLVTIYPGVGSSVSLFAATFIAQFIGVVLMLLLMQMILRSVGRPRKFLPFAVPFLWIENVQQLFGGMIQNLVILTSDHTILLLILPLAVWTCYWMWRIGRDVIGKGGFLAAALVGLSMMVDVTLLFAVQSRALP